MRKIASSQQLLQLLEKDKAIIRIMPYGGRRVVKKYCSDCIDVPNEFKNIDDLHNWRDFIKSKANYKIIGRSYVIDLILGKNKLGTGNLSVRGNVLTISAYNAINYVSKKVNKDINKILDYSLITLRGYTTFIPSLLKQGVALAKDNKIDEALNTFNKFRLILYTRENEANSPKELLRKIYRGNNLKDDWEKLSPIWKEIIYYLIDSSLGLLPGESKREIGDLEPLTTEEVNVSPIDYPEYVDIVNLALSELKKGNNVIIKGSLKTGKSTISELVKRRALELKIPINIVDYHNISGEYKSIQRLSNSNPSQTLLVLTDDLYSLLKTKGYKINVDSRFIFSISRNKGLTLRLDDKIFSIPVHYIVMYQQDNIEDTIANALEHFYKDYWEYVYNVIFDADPNKVLWYSPLLAVYEKYFTPIPEKISILLLKNSGRKNIEENDSIIKWFSRSRTIFKVIKSEDYGTDSIDKIDVDKLIRETALDISNNITSIDDVIELYSYLSVTENEEKVITSQELKSYLDNNLAFARIILPYVVNNLKEKIDVHKYCEDLLNSSLSPYELLGRIKIVLMKSNDENCTSIALNYLTSVAKAGKSEWIRFLLDDISENELILQNNPYQLSVILFNYLKHSTEEIEKVKRILDKIENKTKYSVFVKSLINYLDGNTDSLQLENPLWAVLTYGFLGVYSLSNHDLLKLAYVYDKFRKSYLSIKNNKETQVDPNLKDFFPINNGVFDYIDELKDRLDAGIGYTLLLTHPREESARATIELVEKLIMNWCNRIRNKIKEGKIKDNEAIDLLQIYQIKLMKSLISGSKYEYKSVLRDIIDLEELTKYLIEQDVKGSLLIASSIAKKILGIDQKVETVSGTTLDLILYMASEIILGSEDKSKFFDFIAGQIKNKQEGIDKALAGIISAFIKNDKKELENAIDYARENYYSVMLEILTKHINDKRMFVVSLIPYIGIWHFLGG